MSKVKDLSYDIEQLYIEGYRPKTISAMLECPLTDVLAWIEQANLDWEDSFPVDESFDPFETVNS